MTRFEGEREFPLPPAELFAKLSDARFLAECVPDVESRGLTEANRAEMVLKPNFGFVRGTLNVALTVVEAVAPERLRVDLHSDGIGSSSDVEATLQLSASQGGTRVQWMAELKKLGGLLKLVPSGLIRGAAEKVVNDAWDRVNARLRQG